MVLRFQSVLPRKGKEAEAEAETETETEPKAKAKARLRRCWACRPVSTLTVVALSVVVVLVRLPLTQACSLSSPCEADGCCSEWGYCGLQQVYCGKGCQSGACWPGSLVGSIPSGTTMCGPLMNCACGLSSANCRLNHCIRNGTVSLTYQEGPTVSHLDRLLDVLEDYGNNGIRITIFAAGPTLYNGTTEMYSAAISRAAIGGHQIGAGPSVNLDSLGLTQIPTVMNTLEDTLAEPLAWQQPTYIRSLSASMNYYTLSALNTINYIMSVGYDTDSGSLEHTTTNTTADADAIYNNVIVKTGIAKYLNPDLPTNGTRYPSPPGSMIVLLHTGSPGAIEALPRILDALLAADYDPYSIQDCLEDYVPPYVPFLATTAATSAATSSFLWPSSSFLAVVIAIAFWSLH